MTKYKIFSEAQVIDHVCQLGYFKDAQALSCIVIESCHLRHVFQVFDTHKNSLMVKQAIPCAKGKMESTSSLKRSHIDAEILINHYKHCPDYTLNILHYDKSMACTIYQDLTDYESVRGRLVSTKPTSFVGKQLAHYLAFTLFYTSDFYLSWAEKKAKQVKFINLESCLMTENDLFTAPYQNLDTKSHHQVNQKLALALKEDDDLKAEVAELKGKFLNTSQALLHGDLQTDSIVANDKEIKVIGTQYSFYGPIGFDLGCILGHFLLNFCTSAIFLTSHKKADHLDTLIQIIRETWNHFADLFSQLMANNTHDIALQNDTYHARYLRGIFLDSLGFAGCELIRRALETSPVAEIESITDETKQSLAKQHIIQLGRVLIKKRYQFVSIDDVLLEAEAIIEQE